MSKMIFDDVSKTAHAQIGLKKFLKEMMTSEIRNDDITKC
jgi:hypothetical protein